MTNPKILITGVTGCQGGAVARALYATKKYDIIALSRCIEAEKCNILKKDLPDMKWVQGDLDDSNTVAQAMENVDYLFLVTNYWDPNVRNEEKEKLEAQHAIDAAKKAGVKHVIFSSLQSSSKLSSGKVHAANFDGKALASEYLQSSGVHYTIINLPQYFENFLKLWPPTKDAKGENFIFQCPMADKKIEGMSVEDLGPFVAGILDNLPEYTDKNLSISSEALSMPEYIDVIKKVTGKMNIAYEPLSVEDWKTAKADLPCVEEIAQTFKLLAEYPPTYDHSLLKKLNPKAMNFEQFVQSHKECFEKLLV